MISPILAEAGLNPSDYLQFGSLGVGFFNIFLSWRLISALNKQDQIKTQHVILVCIFVASALGFLLGGAFLHRMEQNPEVTIRLICSRVGRIRKFATMGLSICTMLGAAKTSS